MCERERRQIGKKPPGRLVHIGDLAFFRHLHDGIRVQVRDDRGDIGTALISPPACERTPHNDDGYEEKRVEDDTENREQAPGK